jgi:hypothetical protein
MNLNFINKNDFELELKNLDNFFILSDDEKSKNIKKRFKDKIKKESKNIIILSEFESYVSYLIDKKDINVLAPIEDNYYKNKPLFLISIPKAGTYLLLELVELFGYKKGEILDSNPQGGKWYYLDSSKSHTPAKRFFIDKAYHSPFGNRDHPFISSPVIFIYRNPLDIVVSEANYYHKEAKSSFYNYLSNLNFNDRLAKLINDKWLLGSIRDRISNYVAWNYFQNVISISFEELIGEKGGGNSDMQLKLIWSLMLKLQVPGDSKEIANQVFNPKSDTFFKAQIGSYKDCFTKEHYKLFNDLEQDFMEEFGYSFDSDFSNKIDHFIYKELYYPKNIQYPPILKEASFYGFNLVKDNKIFIAYSLDGVVKLTEKSLEKLKIKVLEFIIEKNR